MRIGELAQRSGISASAIRYYERLGLLPKAERHSGHRRFDDRALAQLVVVRLAKEARFSLPEIRQLVSDFARHRWNKLAQRKRAEIDATITRLQVMSGLLERLLQCQCFDLEVCGRRLERSGLIPRRVPATAVAGRSSPRASDRRP